jgi:fructose-bisphosphate aldolase class II
MNAREWFEKARKENFAIGAFNIDALEIFKAVLVAAQNKKSPVMLEFSPGEIGYFGLKNIVDMVINAREDYKIPILLNLDHVKSEETIAQALKQPGLDNIHFDGSDLEITDNIRITRDLVSKAHSKGLLVEGEIDKVAGSSIVHVEEINPNTLVYTDVKRAMHFVDATKVDIFAPVFGNLHGTFPNQPDLDMGLLANIAEALPDTFLSLHGSSGIPADQVKEAIKVGKIVKININTELRESYKDALEEELGENPDEYKVYDLTQDVIEAVAAVVENKIDVFGSGGKAK